MSTYTCTCLFRVWVSPADPPTIEVWYHGLEQCKPDVRFNSEWFAESFSNEDMHDLFDLDRDAFYQVVGKATLTGYFDYYGDYDESLVIDEFEKCVVPEEFVS